MGLFCTTTKKRDIGGNGNARVQVMGTGCRKCHALSATHKTKPSFLLSTDTEMTKRHQSAPSPDAFSTTARKVDAGNRSRFTKFALVKGCQP